MSLKRLATFTLMVVAAGCHATQSARPLRSSAPGLAHVLEDGLREFRATTGVYVKHLTTGEEAGVRADQPFNAFSVIKLAIMLRAYVLSEHNGLDLDQRIRVTPNDLRDGSGILYNFDPGLEVSLRDLIMQMITTSDNTATDIVLARVGGKDALNAWLQQSGFDSRLTLTMLDSFRGPLLLHSPDLNQLTPEEIYAYWMYPYQISERQWKADAAIAEPIRKRVPLNDVIAKVAPLWSADPRYWLGSMTPKGTARLLEAITGATLTSRASSDEMRRILLWQREGRLRLPHYIVEADVAHKTGDGPPVIANDAGIVYAANGPFIISFFSSSIAEPYPEHEDRIGRLARRVYDYFEKRP